MSCSEIGGLFQFRFWTAAKLIVSSSINTKAGTPVIQAAMKCLNWHILFRTSESCVKELITMMAARGLVATSRTTAIQVMFVAGNLKLNSSGHKNGMFGLGSQDKHLDSWRNLVWLRNNGNTTPEWMTNNDPYYWNGVPLPHFRGENLCNLRGCEGGNLQTCGMYSILIKSPL